MSNSNKHRLDENITMLGPIAVGTLNYITSQKVTDLKDAELDKRHGKTIQILDDPPEYISKKSSRKIQKKSVIKYPEFMPPNFEIIDPSSTLLFDKSQYKITEPQNIITLPSTCLHNTKLSTANTCLDNKHIRLSFMNHFSDPTPQTFNKTTFNP